MKRAMLSLVLGAAPAALAGQPHAPGAVEADISCPAPCYVAPFFTGRGGFVAEATPEARWRPLTFALTCGKAVLTRTVTPDGEGIVRQAFTRDNGLACDAEYGRIEISGVAAGGWYWINDDPNSALASLLSSEVLGFEQVRPADPGGVTIVSPEGGAVSFIKHEPSGRVGLIPHIQPGPETPPCAGGRNLLNDCLIGSSFARFEIVLRHGNEILGDAIVRGGADGETYVVLTASLGGHGYLPVDGPPYADFHVGAPGSTAEEPVDAPGVTHAFPSADIGIQTEASGRCGAENELRDNPVRVVVRATPREAGLGTFPSLPSRGIERTLTVSCPEIQRAGR